MAIPILTIGKSGSGKSTSLSKFEHDEIALINVLNKPLPFKGKFDSAINPLKNGEQALSPAQSYEFIKQAMLKTEKKSIVIDDFGYLLTNHLMVGKEQGGNKFDLFDDIASKPWNLIEWIRERLPEDKIVYIMMHEDESEFGGIKPKTIGRMLDDKICLEGLFTIVIRCVFKDEKHMFEVHMKGSDVTKTPVGMFEQDEVDNDLKLIDTTVRSYYQLTPLKAK